MTAAEKFAILGRVSSIPRTGWVERGIQKPESVAEHMYSCWLLGELFLPDTAPEPDYDRDAVLRMLLLHDLAESMTGDIPRPVKQKNPALYDRQEDEAMRRTFLSDNTRDLPLWESWCAQQDYNSRLAKDIDEIQAVYTFCRYREKEPSCFSEEDSQHWLRGLESLRTRIGREIATAIFDHTTA